MSKFQNVMDTVFGTEGGQRGRIIVRKFGHSSTGFMFLSGIVGICMRVIVLCWGKLCVKCWLWIGRFEQGWGRTRQGERI